MAIESKRPQMKDFKDRFIITARTLYGRDLNDLSKEELYQTLSATVKQYVSGNWIKTNRAYKDRGVKQVYYFSVEFLLGRLLNTNLVNLGIRQEVEEQLKELAEKCSIANKNLGKAKKLDQQDMYNIFKAAM